HPSQYSAAQVGGRGAPVHRGSTQRSSDLGLRGLRGRRTSRTPEAVVTEAPPAFLLYVKDFLSDDAVSLMTNEQIGAYILLLCHQWKRPDGLPAAMASLAKLARCTPRSEEH